MYIIKKKTLRTKHMLRTHQRKYPETEVTKTPTTNTHYCRFSPKMATMEKLAEKLVDEVIKYSEEIDLAAIAGLDEDETKANEEKHRAMFACYVFCENNREKLKREYQEALKKDYNHYLIVLTFLYKYAQTWLHDNFFLRNMSLKNYEKAYKKFVVPEGVEKFRF